MNIFEINFSHVNMVHEVSIVAVVVVVVEVNVNSSMNMLVEID